MQLEARQQVLWRHKRASRCAHHVGVSELRRTPARDGFTDVLMQRHENDEEHEEDGRVASVESVEHVVVAPELQVLHLRQPLDQRKHGGDRCASL